MGREVAKIPQGVLNFSAVPSPRLPQLKRVPLQQHPPSPAVRVDAFAAARLPLPINHPEHCSAGQKPGTRGRRGGQAQDPWEVYMSGLLGVQREGDTAQISQPGRGLKASSGGPFLVAFLTAAILGRSLQSRGARGGGPS